jgi:hypothetical protein
MASAIIPLGNMTDAELFKNVQKDSTERLIIEMKTGQNKLDSAAVDKLSRTELVSYVTLLRKLSGQTNAVKSLMLDYDPGKVGTLDLPRPGTPTILVPTVSASAGAAAPGTVDANAIMALMMQMHNQNKEAAERQEAAAKAERKLALELAKEERKLTLELAERKEAIAAEERKIAADERKALMEAQNEERRLASEAIRLTKLEAERQKRIDDDLASQRDIEHQRLMAEQNKLLDMANRDRAEQHAAEQARADRAEAKAVEDSKRIDIRLKRASSLMKSILYAMPSDSNDLPLYFQNVDRLFDMNYIDDDLRVSLLAPYLTDKARKALMVLPLESINTYEKWKQALLREHRLTPRLYRQNFNSIVREPNETCLQFNTRLTCLLRYYLDSREINGSFDKLVNLILSDRLKDSLFSRTRYHISDREGTGWLESSKIAEMVDLYEGERGREDRPRGDFKSHGKYSPEGSRNNSNNNYENKTTGSGNFDKAVSNKSDKFGSNQNVSTSQSFTKSKYVPQGGKWKAQIRCRRCSKLGHFSYECRVPNVESRANYVGVHSDQDKPTVGAYGKPRTCYRCGSLSHLRKDCSVKIQDTQRPRVNYVSTSELSSEDDSRTTRCKSFNVNRVETFTEHSVSSIPTNDNVKPTLSKEILVKVDFGVGPVSCVIDSGAEISVVKSNMIRSVSSNDESACTEISLQGAFGPRVPAFLMNVSAHLLNFDSASSRLSPVLLTCAICDDLTRDVALLSLGDYEALRCGLDEFIPEVKLINKTTVMFTDPRVSRNPEAIRFETVAINSVDKVALLSGEKLKDFKTDSLLLGTDLTRLKTVTEYREAQSSDPSLRPCWDLLNVPGSGFYKNVDNQLLFRDKLLGGFQIAQLVLPFEKRRKVMQVAHDSDWAMHYGVVKTTQRIQAHFYWPTMTKDINDYVKSCVACQKHARKTKFDRVPITPVSRAASSFEQVNIDLIGPLNPKSSRGHQYILCLVDSCTRWPEAVPLRTLTAKELCDALLSIFTRIGIPRIVISDNATNMVSGLNEALYNRLGIELRTAVPMHPEGNSLVERWNQTLKRSLNHIFNSDKPREWDRQLPYLLWAYRELPNATTGISPYQLVYGRLGRGPLSVLKDTWSNDIADTCIVNHTANEYLDKLKNDLTVGLKLAEENTVGAQAAYANQYNVRAKEKEFDLGDLVLVLMPDTSNKVAAQWQGPGTITAILSPHSYRVALDTGAVRTLHANDLRKFVARVDSVGVIFDDDTEFGRIETYSTVVGVESEKAIQALDLSYLSPTQQYELRTLLLKHKDVFDDKPGKCRGAVHEINLVEGFKPKSMRPYRIPDKLKSEVDKQIDELLKAGKIRPSNSPYAHPIVCVAKANGEVRMCTDLRYINSGTINDAYPMPRSEDLLLDISAANFISTLDCTSGYWQIPMRECDIYKTGFVTHRGLYEWLVMPFGVKTASNTYQRVMDNILRRHSSYADAYIDDTAVYSKSWSEHLIHLDGVLTAFSEVGMTLRLSKCKFAKNKVKFIGHEIGSGTRSVIQSKVEAIKIIPEPHNKKLLRSFLGMCAFYRNYIPKYSELALPLTELTKNRQVTNIHFNEVQRAAFIMLKEKLCNSTTLYSPRNDKPFIIRCDSSEYAVGACVAQIDEIGQERPIAFASAKLSEVQRRWSTIEREAYAVIFALQRFDVIVYGSSIVLYTDHNPLQYLAACIPKSAKLTRWSLSLTRYDITVKHIHGKDNVTADCLSRC